MDNSKQNQHDIQTINIQNTKIKQDDNEKKPQIICEDKKKVISKLKNNIQYRCGRFLVTELSHSDNDSDNDI